LPFACCLLRLRSGFLLFASAAVSPRPPPPRRYRLSQCRMTPPCAMPSGRSKTVARLSMTTSSMRPLSSSRAVGKASVENQNMNQNLSGPSRPQVAILPVIVPIVDESAVGGVAPTLADVVATDHGRRGEQSSAHLVGLHLPRSATYLVGHPRPCRISHVPLVAS
jgi:hypothetical protein